MEPIVIGNVGCIVAIILMFLGMPVAYAFGMVGFLGSALIMGWSPALAGVGLYPYTILSLEVYTVVPLFIFMGYIILYSGVGTDFFDMARRWIGHVKGGLGMTTVIASSGFGAVSGDVVSAAVTMSAVSLPETRKYKYHDSLIIGSIAGGANLSFIIPPSLGFILYGGITSTSIGKLFVAGILPGIMIAFLFICLISFLCYLHPDWAPTIPASSWRERFVALRYGWVIIATFLVVIGGIYLGIFTASEAAAVGCAFVVIVTGAKKKLKWDGFKKALLETGLTTGMVMLVLFCCMIFSLFLSLSGVAGSMERYLLSLQTSPNVILIICLILYLLIGLFMDVLAMILVTLPFTFPILVTGLGFDPVFLGVVVILTMILGHITPPFGIVIYSLKGSPACYDIPLFQLFLAALPFAGIICLSIIILIIFPQIAIFLPNLMLN